MDVSGRAIGIFYGVPAVFAVGSIVTGAMGTYETPYLLNASLASLALMKTVYLSWTAATAIGASGLFITAAVLHKLVQNSAWRLLIQGVGTVLFTTTAWLAHKQEFPSPDAPASDQSQYNPRVASLLAILGIVFAAFNTCFAGTSITSAEDKQNESQIAAALSVTALWPTIALVSMVIFQQIRQMHLSSKLQWLSNTALAGTMITMTLAMSYAWQNYAVPTQAHTAVKEVMSGLALALLCAVEGGYNYIDARPLSDRLKARRAETDSAYVRLLPGVAAAMSPRSEVVPVR